MTKKKVLDCRWHKKGVIELKFIKKPRAICMSSRLRWKGYIISIFVDGNAFVSIVWYEILVWLSRNFLNGFSRINTYCFFFECFSLKSNTYDKLRDGSAPQLISVALANSILFTPHLFRGVEFRRVEYAGISVVYNSKILKVLRHAEKQYEFFMGIEIFLRVYASEF